MTVYVSLQISIILLMLTVLKCKSSEWFDLGLKHGDLKTIEANNRKVSHCMREMLAAWLKGQERGCTKLAIETILTSF